MTTPLFGVAPYAPATLAIVDGDMFGRYFEGARSGSSLIREATSPFDPADNPADTVYLLTLDGMSGCAIRPDGELVYVFSLERGRGDILVGAAVKNGATHLDCFDGYLPSLYARHGFEEWVRDENWTPGGPDVVFMRRPI